MCIITKKLKATEVRDKRTAMRMKLQSQMFTPVFQKSLFELDQTISSQSLSEAQTQNSSGISSERFIQLEKNYNLEKRNEFQAKYEILEKIGEGGNSTVYKCRERGSEQYFAVKVMRHRDEQLIMDLKYQFEITKLLINDSIIKHEELILDSASMTSYTILQYCEFKNLKEILHSRPERKLPEDQVLKIMHSVLEALNFLHTKGISHRDIKPQNILYNPQNGQIKLIDFDGSKLKKETESHFEMWTKTGTLNYQAPEIFLGATYSQKVDIWAFGVLVYELLTGKLPFQSAYSNKTIKLIVSSEIDFQSLEISESLKALLKGLLKKQPLDRFDTKEAQTIFSKTFLSTQAQI